MDHKMDNIERLLDAAKNGDAGAMLDLGDLAIKTGTSEGTDQAIYWFSNAAKKGSPLGVFKLMTVYKGKAIFAKRTFSLTALAEYANKIVGSYALLPQNEDLPEKFVEMLQNTYSYGLYLQAFAKYFQDEPLEATCILADIEPDETPTPLTYILMGCCQFALFKGNENDERFEQACTLLSLLEHKPEIIVNVAEDRLDQLLLFKAFSCLAIALRLHYKDIQRAYNILKKGHELITEEEIKAMLLDEMSHYRPKFFGGLQYV